MPSRVVALGGGKYETDWGRLPVVGEKVTIVRDVRLREWAGLSGVIERVSGPALAMVRVRLEGSAGWEAFAWSEVAPEGAPYDE